MFMTCEHDLTNCLEGWGGGAGVCRGGGGGVQSG